MNKPNEPRKPWYGTGKQPWDVIKALGWAPAFAAANVIKYLRRTKDPAHSLESARWYYARLREMAEADSTGNIRHIQLTLLHELTDLEVDSLTPV